VDLDPLEAYHHIHGLAPPPAALRHHLTRVALPRFLRLFEALEARATFFVVGRDLADPAVREELRSARAAGHELANHTWSHSYDFLDQDPTTQREEILRCHEALATLGSPSAAPLADVEPAPAPAPESESELAPAPESESESAPAPAPLGFRAPGYHVSAAVLAQLGALGYRYDSSVLSSAPYWLAKAAVMARLRLAGRPSRARLHAPTDLFAPRRPYRPDPRRPWRPARTERSSAARGPAPGDGNDAGDAPLTEIPAASLVAGMPLVGTFLGALPAAAARLLGAALRHRDFVTVEFHAIDLVGRADGGLEALARCQPGVATPLALRRAAYEALLAPLCRGARAVPLAALVR